MYRASSVTFFLLITAVFGRSEFAAASDSEAKAQLQERDLFAAFYYAWYVAEEWENDWDAEPARPYGTDGARPLRLYGSDDPKIFNRHLDLAEESAIDRDN